MSHLKQIELSKTKIGRIKLHLICFFRDYKFSFHVKGIGRELI